jgi:hypothetical protein
MSAHPMLIHYVSEIDQFLQAFDHNHPALSKSQQKEQAKYRRIYLLRDHPNSDGSNKTIWENF